jgi:hypothetical protein
MPRRSKIKEDQVCVQVSQFLQWRPMHWAQIPFFGDEGSASIYRITIQVITLIVIGNTFKFGGMCRGVDSSLGNMGDHSAQVIYGDIPLGIT